MASNPDFNYRPWPAPCLHCGRRARRSKVWTNKATWYCSDRCRWSVARVQSSIDARGYANAIRHLLGMPGERCEVFTLPELRMMHRRIERLLPYGALPKKTVPKRRRRSA